MKRRTLLKAAAAFPVTLLSGCAVYDDGLYGGYYETGVIYQPVPHPPPSPASRAATAAPASPSGTASSSETRAAASETGSATAFRRTGAETGVPAGASAPWASPPRGSADDESAWRSAPDRSWQTGTGFPESSRTPRRSRCNAGKRSGAACGTPPGSWSSSGSRSAPRATAGSASERSSWPR